MKQLLVLAGLCASMNLFAEDLVLGPSGGMGGGDFVDKVPAHYTLIGVRLCGGSIVDSIQSIYSADGQTIYGTKHGGNGGGCETLLTGPNEYITGIYGCRSERTVTNLRVATNKTGHWIEKGKGDCFGYEWAQLDYGNRTEDAWSIQHRKDGYYDGLSPIREKDVSNRRIRGFNGRSGSYLDAIGVVVGQIGPSTPSDRFSAVNSGGKGGGAFYSIPDQKISKLRICSGTKVDSIQVNDGTKHGGNGGGCTDIHLVANEYIRELYGHYDSKGTNGLTSLNILTTTGRLFLAGDQGRGTNYRYQGNDSDQIIKGLKGRSGDRIDAIGIVY